MPPDPHDEVFCKTVSGAVVGIMRAVHAGDRLRVIGELALLLTSIVEHEKTLGDRPGDEQLRRAVARLYA